MNFLQSDIAVEIESWIRDSCIPAHVQHTNTHSIVWPLYNQQKFIRIMPYFLDSGYRYNIHRWYKDVPAYTKIKIIDFVENSIKILLIPLQSWKNILFPYIFPPLPFLSELRERSGVKTSLFVRCYWAISTRDLHRLAQNFYIFPFSRKEN